MEMTKIIGAAKLLLSPINMCLFDECSYNLVIFLYLLQSWSAGKGLRDHRTQCFYFIDKIIQFKETKSLDPGHVAVVEALVSRLLIPFTNTLV